MLGRSERISPYYVVGCVVLFVGFVLLINNSEERAKSSGSNTNVVRADEPPAKIPLRIFRVTFFSGTGIVTREFRGTEKGIFGWCVRIIDDNLKDPTSPYHVVAIIGGSFIVEDIDEVPGK